MRTKYNSATSIVKTLLWTNVFFFVLQMLAQRLFGSLFVESYLSLHQPSFLDGKFWMPLTYSFLHGNFQHILFNGLAIFFIGKMLEPLLSARRFLILYLGGALCGGGLWMALNWGSPYPLVGASAASMALLMCYCLLRPNEPVTLLLFFIIPLTVKPKWIIWGTFAFEVSGLLMSELRPVPTSNISHSAHLGGALWGLAFCFFLLKGQSLQSLWQSIHIESPRWASRRRKLHVVKEHINR